MKSYIKYIGLFDQFGNCHNIELTDGLNVITGRSSTGKSAIIEIFDYCTGNSDNTIPDGVITENAMLYFIVFEVNNTGLVLARRQEEKSNYAFLKVDSQFPRIEDLNIDYFNNDYFVPLKAFKEELGHFWGITISVTDEDEKDLDYKSKKGRPSFRNMISFLLQHQNLVANKHSLFYRFDEKEKRERTIDEFKIFSGFVDQQYFVLKQKLNEKQREYEKETRLSEQYEEDKQSKIIELDNLLNEYSMISGNKLFAGMSGRNLLNSPQIYLDKLQNLNVNIDETSEEYRNQYKTFEFQKNHLISERRKISLKLEQINFSIGYVEKYNRTINNLRPISEAITEESYCPFCLQESHHIRKEVNKLIDAIDWLNTELKKTPLMLDSFLPEQRRLEQEIKLIESQLDVINSEIRRILKVNEDLEKNRSLEEQALKVQLTIENYLDWSLNKKNQIYKSNLKELKSEIQRLEHVLSEDYNVEEKLKEAEIFVNQSMNLIGEKLDFEKSYQPVNLHFDIETFELYHLKIVGKAEKKVYLRSMGSGANWLYSHVCLFLSLLKYFSLLGDKSLVPTVLFLDQPSQVYFPAIIDKNKENFDYKKLKEIEGDELDADADLQSVTNLFQQIISFINNVNEECGFRPQIIISDHADDLTLVDDSFDNYVRCRWRKESEGLINLDVLRDSSDLES